MHRLNVVILQDRPFHLMSLHQAFNALGIFRVRVAEDQATARRMLARKRTVDLLVLDHALAPAAGIALLEQMARVPRNRAVLFIGGAESGASALAVEARQRGLWVLGELRWPLSMFGLRGLLQRLRGGSTNGSEEDIASVTSVEHAH